MGKLGRFWLLFIMNVLLVMYWELLLVSKIISDVKFGLIVFYFLVGMIFVVILCSYFFWNRLFVIFDLNNFVVMVFVWML